MQFVHQNLHTLGVIEVLSTYIAKPGIKSVSVSQAFHTLGVYIPLDVMTIIVAVSQLNIDPEFIRSRRTHGILSIVQHGRRRHTPLVAGKE
jgi:hypothetical protein